MQWGVAGAPHEVSYGVLLVHQGVLYKVPFCQVY